MFNSLLISRSRVVQAAPADVFEVLATPRLHSAIDGSGTVRGAAEGGPDRLSQGARFGMSMRLGVPYSMTNTVSEFEEGRLIAWHHVGGHVWRYELEPLEGGRATRVTETFDGRSAKFPPALFALGVPWRHPRAIERTLDRLQARFAQPSAR